MGKRIFAALAALICAASGWAAETPKEIIAARVKGIGYPCPRALAANRDLQHPARNEVMWILRCENATYRVGLVPDMSKPIRVHETLSYDHFIPGAPIAGD